MSEGAVHLERAGAIAKITFDRPAARNAMTWTMYEQLARIASSSPVMAACVSSHCAAPAVKPLWPAPTSPSSTRSPAARTASHTNGASTGASR